MRATRAEIDLNNLRYNYREVKRISNNLNVMPVIKANAYGHGLTESARVFRSENAEYLAVAYIDEAIALRDDGDTGKILVLIPESPNDLKTFIEFNIALVISNFEFLAEISQITNLKKNILPDIHIHIDTGMARDGFNPLEINKLVEKIKSIDNVHFSGICTHFASSPSDIEFSTYQLKTFLDIINVFKVNNIVFKYIHASNSGACINSIYSGTNLFRIGIANYGYVPEKHLFGKIELKPVMSLKSKIIMIRRIKQGESVGYDRSYITNTSTYIATIPIGYGDGYSKLLSNKAKCIIADRIYPIRGSVCMDEIMVDLGDDYYELGTDVILLGKSESKSISAFDLSELTGTIPYEITTAISSRVPRIFISE